LGLDTCKRDHELPETPMEVRDMSIKVHRKNKSSQLKSSILLKTAFSLTKINTQPRLEINILNCKKFPNNLI
jgi:hypothetical protein